MATQTQALFGILKRDSLERGIWTRIGTAFRNRDGSWNLRFDYLPAHGDLTVQMRPAKSAEHRATEQPEPAPPASR